MYKIMKKILMDSGVLRLCTIFIFALFFLPIFSNAATGHSYHAPPLEDQQQKYQLTGTVTDSYGPLPGVHILIKGTNTGTFSDKQGEFSLIVTATNTLVFSYIGYKALEMSVLGRNTLEVELLAEATQLQEVEVNAGYYTVKERERTGSISRVTAAEIELQPIVSPLESLQGRMAGVEIIPGGNLPGMAPTIRIRGTNSLREEGNFPLYIIDGVPINSTPIDSYSNLGTSGIDPLSTLNLSNIESIEVLKDADATAIYGSRGANGIILITTKKGRKHKTEIEARVYTGMSSVPNRLDLLNTEQYLQIRKKAFENDGVEPTERNAYDLLVWDPNRYTDWQEVFFGGTSVITDVNLAATGGNETTSFRLGGSYHKQGSVFPGDLGYNKATAGLNLDHISKNKKFALNLAVNYGVDVNDLVGNIFLTSHVFRLPPNAPTVFNEDGSLFWEEWGRVGLSNPFEGYFNSSKTQANNLVSNLGLSYQFSDRIIFKINGGYTYFNSSEIIKRPKRSYNPVDWDNMEHQSSHLYINRKSWIIEPQVVYNTKIGEGAIDALLGGTFQQNKNSLFGVTGTGYVAESLIGNLNAAENITNGSSQNTEYRYNAIFARLGLNLSQKYYINLTGRRDGSSRFGRGKQFANFGAIGGAWIFSEEPFMKNSLPFLSFGKFWGSYGITGNDQIGDYGYLDAYESTLGPGGLYPTQLANPDYSWEENKKLQGSIDLGFFRDRINFGIEWYRNRSSNQLVGYPLPTMTGFASVQANLPAMVQNSGWELELSTLNFQTRDFRWQTSLNMSFPKNELISYPNIEQSSFVNTYKVGHPLDIALLYQYDGIDPETGFYKIMDINGDERFDYEDRVVIKDRGRQYFGGINNNINYKGFSVQFLWEFVKQEGTLFMFNPGELAMQRAIVLQATGENGQFQRISSSVPASTAYSYVLSTTFPYTDASFVRLKTCSLGYNLPSTVLQTIGVHGCRVFLNGQNLITVTNYKGMDPQMPNGGTTFAGLRTITCGIQLNF